jgi:hypothetical protein
MAGERHGNGLGMLCVNRPLVVVGLGVKDKHDRREILILFSVISFWDLGSEKRPVIEKQEYAVNWNKKFYMYLHLSNSTS